MLADNKASVRRLPAHLERTVAVSSQTDPRTVRRVVAGLPTREATRARILKALRVHGGGFASFRLGRPS